MPAEILDKSTAIEKAWCYKGKGFGDTRCYRQKKDCVRQAAHQDLPKPEEQCIWQGPEQSIAELMPDDKKPQVP